MTIWYQTDDLGKQLEHLEELVRSISGDHHDVKQQQQGLGVAVIRLEKNSLGACDGTPAASVAAAAATLGGNGGDNSIVPSGAPGRPLHNHHRRGVDTESDVVGEQLPPLVHKI
jgi:hypothetical protein